MSFAHLPERYHGLDALRGIAMLLGIVLHAAIPYYPDLDMWPKDRNSSEIIELTFDFIHIWRMPVFFMLAGFFANLIISRKSWLAWWLNRWLRVALPMIIFFPLIGSSLPWIFEYGWSGDIRFFYSNEGQPHHLWFLWHLMIFVVLTMVFSGPAVALRRLSEVIDGTRIEFIKTSLVWIKDLAAGIFFRPLVPIGFIILSLIINISTWGELPENLLASGLYFVLGYGLYTNDRLLSAIISQWPTYVLTGLLLFFGYCVLVLTDLTPSYDGSDQDGLREVAKYGIRICCATIFSFGFIGLAESKFGTPNNMLRFVSDGSYWMYLIHLPIVTFITFSMFDWEIPVSVKFAFAVVSTSIICLITYKCLVRHSPIGLLLNGKRYPWKADEQS